MLQKNKKLFKPFGTPVIVKFGFADQLVRLDIKDWDQELKEIQKTHLETKGFSDVYELSSVVHGVSCSCCTKIIRDSITYSYTEEKVRPKSPGRPRRTGRQEKGNFRNGRNNDYTQKV